MTDAKLERIQRSTLLAEMGMETVSPDRMRWFCPSPEHFRALHAEHGQAGTFISVFNPATQMTEVDVEYWEGQ